MPNKADTGVAIFKEEALGLLTELEEALLEMEENPMDMEPVGRAFRALHTIKGSGAMFGFADISSFTHEVETVFDLVRNGSIPVSGQLTDLTLAARDLLKAMLNESGEPGPGDRDKSLEIIAGLKKLLPPGLPQKEKKEGRPKQSLSPPPPTPAGPKVTYRIRFSPFEDILSKGFDPVALLNELLELGDGRVVAHTDKIPFLEDFAPDSCYVFWDVILTTGKGIDAIKDVFIFIESECDLKIDVINGEEDFPWEAAHKKLGEILIERGDLTAQDLESALRGKKYLGELLVEAGIVNSAKVESALVEQKHIREAMEKRKAVEAAPSVRVASEKLDTLVDLVGEMVTVQARLAQTADVKKDPDLLQISEEVERLTAELRDNAMSIRMLPIGGAFGRLKRLVRDLSRDLGKEVELSTSGAETELDKNMIERLNDPLVHLIRNSIDHGIESPEIRKAAGKPAIGTIHLSAAHSGARVLIEIKDDGAGLDAEAIRLKAVKNGMISPDAALSEKELFNFIFFPGFSTARNVTSVSGRGVGMDVVRSGIDSLRGAIDIESRKGEGTKITLQLPLTLAIIEGLLVKISNGNFVLPLSSVEECVELTRRDAALTHGHRVAMVRGEIIPYINLREFFMAGGDSPEIEQIVITNQDGRKVGLVVDEIVGGRQTVIKSLGKVYKDAEWFSGSTILGDGTVALILDIGKLLQTAEFEETN